MKVLCVGGGSGGHVTPVLAVLSELAKTDPNLSVVFVTDKAFLKQTQGLVEHLEIPVTVKVIAAGKFRRYMDVARWKQVIRPDIGGRNLLDMFKTAAGVVQSLVLLAKVRPDVVFAKGGYVSIPVGLAAHLFRVPLVIHDSDARPGLTNRVLSRWAASIATGMPVENYNYDVATTHYTGVPVAGDFRVYSQEDRRNTKQLLGFARQKPLVVVTGGGLGAKDINQAMVVVADQLLEQGYTVCHISGKTAYDELKTQLPQGGDYHLEPFVYEGFASLYGAADVVVSRASATSLQELAAAARPAVIVPNSSLGDQLENAALYGSARAAVVVSDEALQKDPAAMLRAIRGILEDPKLAAELSENIHKYAKPEAATEVAKLIFKAGE